MSVPPYRGQNFTMTPQPITLSITDLLSAPPSVPVTASNWSECDQTFAVHVIDNHTGSKRTTGWLTSDAIVQGLDALFRGEASTADENQTLVIHCPFKSGDYDFCKNLVASLASTKIMSTAHIMPDADSRTLEQLDNPDTVLVKIWSYPSEVQALVTRTPSRATSANISAHLDDMLKTSRGESSRGHKALAVFVKTHTARAAARAAKLEKAAGDASKQKNFEDDDTWLHKDVLEG